MGQKRKWLAALLVLAMLVSVMPLAVFAEGEGEECKSDHSNVTCAEPCTECGFAPKHQYSEGICTVCGAEEPKQEHTCTPASDWSKDVNGHWRACTDPNCGVKLDYVEHDYGTEGTCVCGATKPAHTCAPASDWSKDANGHWRACTDPNCGVKLDSAEHNYGTEGTCVCGATKPAHTCTPASDWSKDETGHWHACTGEGCDEKLDYQGHTDDTNHECTVCGYVCKHENVEYNNEILGQNGHTKLCVDCGEYLGIFEHTMENGECSGCGYAPCEEGNHSYDPEAESYDRHRCLNCGYIENCVDKEPVDCLCDICGEACHDWYVEPGEEKHYWLCGRCDYSEEEDHVGMGDGVCDFCGYGCKHENVEYNYENVGQYGHSKLCVDCGEYLGFFEHTMENGKCSGCGYAPCEEGNHSYDPEAEGFDRHRCLNCGFIEDHVDEDNDCVCDICGGPCHIGETKHNETHCWMLCEKCGQEAYKGEHFDFDNDQKCDWCGYDMSSSSGGDSAKDESLDDVPKTGDITGVILAAAMTAFGGSGAALLKRKFTL